MKIDDSADKGYETNKAHDHEKWCQCHNCYLLFLFVWFLDQVEAERNKQQHDPQTCKEERVELYALLHDSCEDDTAKYQFCDV